MANSSDLLAQSPDLENRDEIKRWVSDLLSPSYSRRELASEQLKRLAGQSLELILEELETADGESHARLLTLIADLATNPESPVSKPAFQGLLKLSTRTSGAKSLQIKQIVGSIQSEVAKLAWQRYKRKSKNNETAFPSRSNPEHKVLNPVVIDASFTGTYDDLSELDQIDWVNFARLQGPTITRKHLEAVLKLPKLTHLQLVDVPLTSEDLMVIKQGPDLDILEIQYVPIGDEIVDHLASFPVWTEIWIYGTKISRAGLERAESMLGDVVLTYSRGAFLGVRCNSNDVTVAFVEPDSAADSSGILEGDRLRSINGRRLARFDDLREELGKFSDGEEVEIEYMRAGELIKTKVVLGKRKR
ncbi:MAG: PDZ domain-containing protein [Pirellula sp.]|nr:PDZ domain-containing protein [Pirellula sp.]